MGSVPKLGLEPGMSSTSSRNGPDSVTSPCCRHSQTDNKQIVKRTEMVMPPSFGASSSTPVLWSDSSDEDSVWPSAGSEFFDATDSFSAWPHMDSDFTARLSGLTSWASLSPVHSCHVGCSVPLPADRAGSASGFRGFEAGSSSFMPMDHLPGDVSAQPVIPVPAPVLPAGLFAQTLSRAAGADRLIFSAPFVGGDKLKLLYNRFSTKAPLQRQRRRQTQAAGLRRHLLRQ